MVAALLVVILLDGTRTWYTWAAFVGVLLLESIYFLWIVFRNQTGDVGHVHVEH